MSEKSPMPEKNSAQWVRNEKIINETPYLRAARDRAEGFSGNSRRTTLSTPSQAYKDNWDKIFGDKK